MKLYIILFLLFSTQVLFAQQDNEEGIFTASVLVGMNISQIDGDAAWGYSKVGLNVGARGGVRFGKRAELCTEILFSQKGAANIPKNSQNFSNYTIHLDYLEVPVLFYYKDWEATDQKDRKYMRVMFGAGFSYSRLVNTRLKGSLNHPMGNIDNYKKDDFMFMLDANIFFLRNWAINVRWSRSLLTIYNDEPTGAKPDYSVNRSIIIRAVYRF